MLSTEMKTFVPRWIAAARSEWTTPESPLYVGDLVIAHDPECVPVGERVRVDDGKRGWYTLVSEVWNTATYTWEAAGKPRKVRARDVASVRRVTDGGQWLQPRWTPSGAFVASTPDAMVWTVTESADDIPGARHACGVYRDEITRVGGVAEWQGSDLRNGRVHLVYAHVDIIARVREALDWMIEHGATVENGDTVNVPQG